MITYKSTCSYCGVGCGVVVSKLPNGKIAVEGDKEHPVNKGMLCSKGMNLHYTVMDQTDRLLYPEMRLSPNHPMQRVSWDAALEKVAKVFKTNIEKYGPESVGFYVSGQCLTEEYYVINKLIKGFIGSNNIDTNSRLCMSSAVVGYKMTIGEDSPPISYEDIEHSDCMFITGANPAWCHPILYRRIEAHKTAHPEVKIIVADPRRTQSCDLADLHLQLKPGTDITLYNAIGRALIEMDCIDVDFIQNHSQGFEAYKAKVMERTLQEAAAICELNADDIQMAARWIGEAKGYLSMWTMGLNQSSVGVNKNLSLIDLSLITGKIGKPGNGPFSLTGQPNAMGGREVGGLANLLPNHRDLANEAHRQEVAEFWGGNPINPKPGYAATEMFDALRDDKLKAIWIVCTNPTVSLPDARLVDEALRRGKFVVVQDISKNAESVKYADVVLPAAMWSEKEGTMTNSERRITHLPKINDAPGEAMPDADIIINFAHKMGFGAFFDYQNASQIFDEHCQLSAGTNQDISGLNYDILKNRSVQWPFPKGHTGNGMPRLFADNKFFTANGLASIHAVPDENTSEPIDPEFPLIMTTGRIRDQWHTMTRTGKVQKLNQHTPHSYIEIHPEDAGIRNIKEGDLVAVKGRRGDARVVAKISDDIKKGVTFMPMHWGKSAKSDLGRTNNLTNSLFDPKSKEPDFKFTAVEIQKYIKPVQKICIIGAGAGAYGFIKQYRELNSTDEIHVFSKEPYAFYNRILLPDYISGSRDWQDLQKLFTGESDTKNLVLHIGNEILKIDKELKLIYDSKSEAHPYDILLMATGSRAIIPREIPSQMKGIYPMRTRTDADNFKKYATSENHVVVVGGGLLGLEMAGALREMNVQVSVVQRSPRLMERQLDVLSSELLDLELKDLGIEIFYNDEVQTFYGHEHLEGIKLASGKTINCQAMIVAIGTIPNAEIARAAGLECNRGVVVDSHLRTSDSSIYAIGELAEFEKKLFGITSAAEEQARLVAHILAGNDTLAYKGSTLMNILKIQGVNLCSVGEINVPENDPEFEEIVFLDKSQRYYKKCVIQKDKMIGCVLMGDKGEFSEYKKLIEDGIELSEKRLTLLRSAAKIESVEGKLVCSCNSVGEGNIINKIKQGCTDFKELCQATGAGLGCGSCRPEVRKILESTLSPVMTMA